MGIAQRLTVVKQHDTEPAHHLRAGSRRTHGHTGYRTRRKRSGGAGFQQPSIPAKSPTMVLNPISVLLFLRMDKFFPHPRACLPRMCSARARFARAPISLAAPKPGHTHAPGTYICMMPLTRAHASPAPCPSPECHGSPRMPRFALGATVRPPLLMPCSYPCRSPTAASAPGTPPLVILSQPNWWTIVTPGRRHWRPPCPAPCPTDLFRCSSGAHQPRRNTQQ
jgi:hypothetical protein